jgi:hypothetical protein
MDREPRSDERAPRRRGETRLAGRAAVGDRSVRLGMSALSGEPGECFGQVERDGCCIRPGTEARAGRRAWLFRTLAGPSSRYAARNADDESQADESGDGTHSRSIAGERLPDNGSEAGRVVVRFSDPGRCDGHSRDTAERARPRGPRATQPGTEAAARSASTGASFGHASGAPLCSGVAADSHRRAPANSYHQALPFPGGHALVCDGV